MTKWLPSYKRANFRYDALAGVTVSALVIPKALGYAGIAQIPIEGGLYAAAAGALLYSIFGTSRQISTGPSSALAAVAAGAVAATAVSGDDTAELVAAITIMTGLLFFLLALFKMGWISRYLSKAVITGFLFGAALQVVIGELPKLTGTEASGDNSWQKFDSWIEGLDQISGATLWVGAISLAAIVILRFAAPKVPGALVLVIGGMAATKLFDLEDHGVATVGDVPRGLPAPDLPSWSIITDNFSTIMLASLALLLIGFSQTAGDARTFATRHSYRIDIDQESVAQGMCNVGSGVFQGMPVSTSLSSSSLNDSSGARTQMASAVTGLVVILTLIFLAPVFSNLPVPVLSAIIVDAVVFGMMDVKEMRRMFRVDRFDFWIAIAAIVGVLSAGVLSGVVIGIILSLGWLVYINAQPETPELGRIPGSTGFQPVEGHPENLTYAGVFVMRFDGGLYFVTSEVLGDRLLEAVTEDDQIRQVVIDFGGVVFIDSQGSAAMGQIVDAMHDRGGGVRLARVNAEVREMLELDGVVSAMGEDHIHVNLDEAVTAAVADAT